MYSESAFRFMRCLGVIVLLTAALLFAGCDDSSPEPPVGDGDVDIAEHDADDMTDGDADSDPVNDGDSDDSADSGDNEEAGEVDETPDTEPDIDVDGDEADLIDEDMPVDGDDTPDGDLEEDIDRESSEEVEISDEESEASETVQIDLPRPPDMTACIGNTCSRNEDCCGDSYCARPATAESGLCQPLEVVISGYWRWFAKSPAGDVLAGILSDRVYLWDAETLEPLDILNSSVPVSGAAFSPDGSLLVTIGANAYVRVWDVATRAIISAFTGDQIVRFPFFLNDNQTLVFTNHMGGLSFWNARTGEKLEDTWQLQPGGGLVYSMTISPDRSMLAVYWPGNTVDIYRVSDRQLLHSVTPDITPRGFFRLLYSPDSSLLVVGDGSGVIAWDTATGETAWSISLGDASFKECIFSDNGDFLYYATVSDGLWQMLRWDCVAETETTVISPRNEGYFTLGLALSSEEQRMAMVGWPGQYRTYTIADGVLQNGYEYPFMNGGNVQTMAISPQGGHAAFGTMDGTRVLNIPDWDTLQVLEDIEDSADFLGFSPDDAYLIGSDYYLDTTVRWNLTDGSADWTVNDFSALTISPDASQVVGWDGEKLVVLNGETGQTITDIALDNAPAMFRFCGDGSAAVVAYRGSTAAVETTSWEAGSPVAFPENLSALQFSPDCTHMVAVDLDAENDSYGLYLLRVSDGAVLGSYTSSYEMEYASKSRAAFSPDGSILAASVGSNDYNGPIPIHLFSVPDMTLLGTLKGTSSTVFTLAFSADGRTLYSLKENSGVRVWDISSFIAQSP